MSDLRVQQLGKVMRIRQQRMDRWTSELRGLQAAVGEGEQAVSEAEAKVAGTLDDLAGLAQWAADHLGEAGRWAETMNTRKEVLRHRLGQARAAQQEAEAGLQSARDAASQAAQRLMRARGRHEGLLDKRRALLKEAAARDELKLLDEAAGPGRHGGFAAALVQRNRNA